MKTGEIGIVRSALRPEIGMMWPVFLGRCALDAKRAFKKSRWAALDAEEAELAKRLSVLAPAYQKLMQRFGQEKAFSIMEQMIALTGRNEMWDHLDSMVFTSTSAMERLQDFSEAYSTYGADRFMEKEILQQDTGTYSFIITDCAIWDFFNEAGVPELTRPFCESDRLFYPQAFPEVAFSRGDSWENTIAYGRDHCENRFETM